MVGRGYSGRRRHPLKIVLYSVLTLGVYGRVHVYRTLKELDGHEALFLDLKIYRILLVLPIIGPFIAKWRLAALLPKILQHDEGAASVHVGGLRWAALVPWFPLFHVLVQVHLNPHWALHRKMDDLEAKREVLTDLQQSRRGADQEHAKGLEQDVKRREEELDNARQAAVALRAADDARRLAEAEIRKAGGRKRPFKRVFAFVAGFRSARTPAAEPEGGTIPSERPAAPTRTPGGSRFRLKRTPPAEPTPEPGPEPAPVAEAGQGRRWGFRLKPRRGPVVPESAKAAPEAAGGSEPSRAERRALRKAEKAKRKEEKSAAKLLAKQEKGRRKEEQRASKLRAKMENARAVDSNASGAQPPMSDVAPSAEERSTPGSKADAQPPGADGRRRPAKRTARKAKARAR